MAVNQKHRRKGDLVNRKETTDFLGNLLVREKFGGIGKYWAREVSIDPWAAKGKPKRIDYMQFVPAGQCSVSDIEKGIFVCYEIKSCKQDVYSGNGLNFLGEKNYIVTTMECYKDLLPDFRDGTFARHLHEAAPESSSNFGIMVAIPFMSEMTDEFEDPTEVDGESGRWKLAVIKKCVPGLRKRPMIELLFCMLRSGH